jgi:hypothetical protein
MTESPVRFGSPRRIRDAADWQPLDAESVAPTGVVALLKICG